MDETQNLSVTFLDQMSNKHSIDIEKVTTGVTRGLSEQSAQQGILVDWDGPDDPQNPQNWTGTRKWSIIILISAITFNQAMSSTIFAPGVSQAMQDFRSENDIIKTLLVSIYVIGLAVGPLFLSPLSELYGRSPLMHSTNAVFLIAAIACALSINIPMLMIFRLLMGVSTISLGGGYVADLMKPEDRGRAMNVWTVGPVLAPVVGPIAGGFISLKTSWRWTFGLVAITGVISMVACFALLPESYAPRLLELKAQRLRKATGNSLLRCEYDTGRSPVQLIGRSVVRPLRMLTTSPIIVIVSLFLAIAYSYMYLMFTTFTDVFEMAYGFDAGDAGLAYIGLGAGSLTGQYALDFLMRRHLAQRRKEHGSSRPEDQLAPLVAAGVLLPVGLFWYGWTVEERVHWIAPILGTAVCGVAISFYFLAVQTYLVDAYNIYAASALAANTLVRCIFGVTIPLAAPPLYSTLGYGWGNTLLGFLALMVVPACWWLLIYGERIRNNPRFAVGL